MSIRLLLVDDSPAMRKFIRRVLDVCGMDIAHCREAANGLEALDAMAEESFDVVLCDVNMPVMSGDEFITELHRQGLANSTPIIVVSTDSTHTRMHRMLELGAKSYVKKPFTPEAMREALDAVLGCVSHAGERS